MWTGTGCDSGRDFVSRCDMLMGGMMGDAGSGLWSDFEKGGDDGLVVQGVTWCSSCLWPVACMYPVARGSGE